MNNTLILWTPELKNQIRSQKQNNKNVTPGLSTKEIIANHLKKNENYGRAWC